jgi:LacI family transcriptional regulator
MATIFDVAQEAGVSIKTVSRVLNDEKNVRPVTRERVQAAIDALGYQPSAAARELRSGKPRSIGMVFNDASSGFQSRLHHAALEACNAAGYFLASGLFSDDPGQWEDELEAFVGRTRVERMILVPPLCGSEALISGLIDRKVTLALISPPSAPSGVHVLRMDDKAAAREIVEHLIALGHSRIAHLAGPADHVASRLRREGYEAALEAAGLPGGPGFVRPGDFQFKSALASAETLLKDPDVRPTAIFCANDDMAAAVCFTASRIGLRVPEDVSVAGFDDVALAATMWPPLTTIAQPLDAIAQEAVSLLAKPPKNGRPGDILLDHKLVVRGSTAPPPAA